MKQPTPWWMWLLPLPVVWWAALLTAGAWQPGMDLLQLMAGLSTVLQRPWDIRWTQYSGRCLLLFTLAYAVGIGMALSNTTATRRGEEHGSARWGDVFSIARRYRDKRGGNLILTQHFSIGWDGYRHKHNINVLVVGGSGAGKTRGYCVPNILEAAGRDQNAPPCSIVCSDPKSEVLRKTGALLIARGYEVRVLDLTSPAASFCYNPLRYIQSDKDALRMIDTLIQATTPPDSKSSDPFWVKSETALLQALVLYLVHEAPEEEQNLPMVMEMLQAAEVREEDDEYESPLDMLFSRLEMRDPESIALKQYRVYKMAAGVVCSKRLLNQAVGKPVYDGLQKIKFEKPRAKYKAENETELKQFYAARRKLTGEFPDGKVNMKKLSAEYDALEQAHETTYGEFKTVRDDLHRLWKVKSCVDTAARFNERTEEQMLQNRPQTRHKKEDISR